MDVQLIVHNDVVDGGGIGVAVVALDGQGTVVALLQNGHGIGVGKLPLGLVHLVFHEKVPPLFRV